MASITTTTRALVPLLFAAIVPMAAAANPPSAAEARRAVDAMLRLIPADDIQHDYRPLQIRVADLDGDGTAEIIYVYTATSTGSTSEQANELVVMTALREGDRRGWPSWPGSNAIIDSDHAAVRGAGHADDVSVHVPGRLEDLQVEGQRIRLRFTAEAGTPLCHERERVLAGLEPCPTPGAQVWWFEWRPGRLQRVSAEQGVEPR